MKDTSRAQPISTQLQVIAQQAIDYPEMVFTTLAHPIDVDWLREAYRLTNKRSASGVDGVSSQEYAANLEENRQDLYLRLKSGRYKAPPVARVWLDKEDGRKRPDPPMRTNGKTPAAVNRLSVRRLTRRI